jgi:hypothetical protein
MNFSLPPSRNPDSEPHSRRGASRSSFPGGALLGLLFLPLALPGPKIAVHVSSSQGRSCRVVAEDGQGRIIVRIEYFNILVTVAQPFGPRLKEVLP